MVNQYLSDPDYADQIRDLMMEHFRDDWEQQMETYRFGRIWPRGHSNTSDRRSLTRETLDGKYVKSFGEKVIANFLFEHDIDYKYEWAFSWDGRNYRPDFTIFNGRTGGIVIEYIGLKGDPEYDAMSEDKRNTELGID